MSAVQLQVPNNMVSLYNNMSTKDIYFLNAILLYNEYRKGNISLGSVANKLGIDIWALTDLYSELDLPLIVGNASVYETELSSLEGII